MTSRTRRLSTFVAATMLGVSAAVVGTAGGAAAQIDPAATKVVGECRGGPGRIALTVLPTGDGTWQVTVRAGRLIEDSRWRVGVVAFSEAEDEFSETYRRRASGGEWTVSTDVAFGAGDQAFFFVDARARRDEGGGMTCEVGNFPVSPAAGYSSCVRGFNLLLLRQRVDGTLVVRHFIEGIAPGVRWRLDLRVHSAEDSQRVVFHNVTSDRRVLRSRVELTGVPEDSMFTMRAHSERGARCFLRINPGPLTGPARGDVPSPRQLIERVTSP